MSLRSFLGVDELPESEWFTREKFRFYEKGKRIKAKQKTRCIDYDVGIALVNYVDRAHLRNLPDKPSGGWGNGSAELVKSHMMAKIRQDNTLSSTDLGDFISGMRHRNSMLRQYHINVLLHLIRQCARDYQ